MGVPWGFVCRRRPWGSAPGASGGALAGCCRPWGTWHHEQDRDHGPALPLAPGTDSSSSWLSPGCWIQLCSITDFQLCL